MIYFEQGQRVELRRDVERFPDFVAPAGARGTVVEASNGLLRVLMDDHIPGAEEWANEIHWNWFGADGIEADAEADLLILGGAR